MERIGVYQYVYHAAETQGLFFIVFPDFVFVSIAYSSPHELIL